jgi:hypothetical protein
VREGDQGEDVASGCEQFSSNLAAVREPYGRSENTSRDVNGADAAQNQELPSLLGSLRHPWKRCISDASTDCGPTSDCDACCDFDLASGVVDHCSANSGTSDENGKADGTVSDDAIVPRAESLELHVKNTFFTFEPVLPPLDRRLRRVASAPGSLITPVSVEKGCETSQWYWQYTH